MKNEEYSWMKWRKQAQKRRRKERERERDEKIARWITTDLTIFQKKRYGFFKTLKPILENRLSFLLWEHFFNYAVFYTLFSLSRFLFFPWTISNRPKEFSQTRTQSRLTSLTVPIRDFRCLFKEKTRNRGYFTEWMTDWTKERKTIAKENWEKKPR